MNPRISKKEWGLIKGALRRVFSRSDLRKEVLEAAIVEHSDPSRPRVKTWVKCAICGGLDAKSNIDVDHKSPVIPINSSMAEMTLQEIVSRLWCDKKDLQTACPPCHDEKTKEENKARRQYKKENKK